MVPSAELRVFQPLEAFPAAERATWERYILGGGMILLPRPVYRDRAKGRLGFLVPSTGEGAHVKLIDGTYYVCPLRTRMRVLAGLLAFREAKPFEGSEALVPADAAKRASKELGRLRRRDPGHVACVMQSPWHVPIRWFVLFDDEERRIVEPDGRHRLSYLTTVRKAIRRAERAIPALRRSDLGPVAEMIVELHQWLLAFDPHSIVELDYDGLCDFMTWDELDDRVQRARGPVGDRGPVLGRAGALGRDLPDGHRPVGRDPQPRVAQLSGLGGRDCGAGGQGQDRTADTAVFSRVLCHLSYLAVARLTGFDPAIFALTGR